MRSACDSDATLRKVEGFEAEGWQRGPEASPILPLVRQFAEDDRRFAEAIERLKASEARTRAWIADVEMKND